MTHWMMVLIGLMSLSVTAWPSELAEAARSGDRGRVEALLDAGVDPRVTFDGEAPALVLASLRGHEPVVRLLLARGADSNAPTEAEQLTALMCAAANGHTPVIRLLLEHGAAVGAANRRGYTALMLAAGYGRLAAVDALLGAGATVDAATPTGWTALMSAAGSGYAEVVRRLIDAGADVNAWTSDTGATPLLCAVGNGHIEVVRLLLARGAQEDFADSRGQTAPALARKLGYEEIVHILSEANSR